MKIFKLILFCAIALTNFKCHAQNKSDDKQAITMLKEFYEAHAKIWSIPPSNISPATFDKKLDSLAGRYCTPKLRKEVKKYLQDGYDLLTDDKGISNESLATMEIKKDTIEENIYIVSYSKVSDKKQVILHVTVVKEGNNYKISSIR